MSAAVSMRDAERWSTSATLNASPSLAGTPCSIDNLGNWVVVSSLIGGVCAPPASLLNRNWLPGRHLVERNALIKPRLLR